jgi:competence protein ComEA
VPCVPSLPRHELAAYAVLAVLIGVLGVRYLHRVGPAAQAPVPAPAASHTVSVAAGGTSAVVDVAGAVRRPGVYTLVAGARVLDAVRRAGGARHGAQLAAINLAARVVDGQQIVVPGRVAAAAAGAPAPDGSAPSTPISLGSATLEQLDTLDGVGPATAQKIVAYRTQHGGFRSIDDLANVPGIGPKKLAAIRPHVQP